MATTAAREEKRKGERIKFRWQSVLNHPRNLESIMWSVPISCGPPEDRSLYALRWGESASVIAIRNAKKEARWGRARVLEMGDARIRERRLAHVCCPF